MSLTASEWLVVFTALHELPAKHVNGIIGKLQAQVTQAEAAESGVPAESE